MTKKIILTEGIGLAACIIMSVIFHDLFHWIGEPTFLAWLSPTNHSIWEHTKIVFSPIAIYSIIQYFILKPKDKINFIAVKGLMSVVSAVSIIVIYYTYFGILGKNLLWIDISMTFIILTAGYYFSYKFLKEEKTLKFPYLYIALFVLFLLMEIIFTYAPIEIPLFLSSGEFYGIPDHSTPH